MKIQDAERETKLDRASIRFYERESFLTPKRLKNGYRDYSEQDIDLLLKIKLLRQLGFSLERILELQQGSADFGDALNDQARTLSNMIRTGKTSLIVCQAMRRDSVQYSTLDSKHYLALYGELSKEDKSVKKPIFRESVPEEIHPWRRFFARYLDYVLLSVIVRFFIIVVFRIRPVPNGFLNCLITVGIGALMVPIEALLLSKMGTTPGKYAVGIHLEEYRGRFLPFKAAIWRSCRVYLEGTALWLPLAGESMMLYRYCKLTGRSMRRFSKYDEVSGPIPMSWDEETEIIYKGWRGKGICVLIAIIAISILITTITVNDSVKPKHRGKELTVSQFAENYNTYLETTDQKTALRLQPDGTKVPLEGDIFIDWNGEEANRVKEFCYILEGQKVKTVSYEN